jgi:hypothetical protein
VLTQGQTLEDHDDMICKLSAVVKKQEKAMEVLTAKIIHLESMDNYNRERLNNHSYCLGVLELPQQVRESRLNPFVLDLILPHLGCSCSISLGVWYCTVFSRVASSSSFTRLAPHSFFHIVQQAFQLQWSVHKLQSSSRRSQTWSSWLSCLSSCWWVYSQSTSPLEVQCADMLILPVPHQGITALVSMEEVVIEPHCSPGSPGVEFIEGSSESKVEGTPKYVPTSPPMDAVADEMAAGPDRRDSLDKDSLEDLTMSWRYGIGWTEDRVARRNLQWE